MSIKVDPDVVERCQNVTKYFGNQVNWSQIAEDAFRLYLDKVYDRAVSLIKQHPNSEVRVLPARLDLHIEQHLYPNLFPMPPAYLASDYEENSSAVGVFLKSRDELSLIFLSASQYKQMLADRILVLDDDSGIAEVVNLELFLRDVDMDFHRAEFRRRENQRQIEADKFESEFHADLNGKSAPDSSLA